MHNTIIECIQEKNKQTILENSNSNKYIISAVKLEAAKVLNSNGHSRWSEAFSAIIIYISFCSVLYSTETCSCICLLTKMESIPLVRWNVFSISLHVGSYKQIKTTYSIQISSEFR
jgi:hypothetical protein